MSCLIQEYLDFSGNTEVPAIFRRWAILSGIGAYLGRDVYMEHGHFRIHPNLYTMLMGSPGTRKSTAVKLVKDILLRAGYDGVAADKTSKEKFLESLADRAVASDTDELFTVSRSEDELSRAPPVNCFIMADEFNDFFATDAMGFISMLANLWDYNGIYETKTKSGGNLGIPNPTISILGGNTPTNFAIAFPPEALGQGFLSRTILIHGEPNGKRIAFPEPPKPEAIESMVNALSQMRVCCQGKVTMDDEAKEFLEDIYINYKNIDDVRFDSYSNRRFSHLLKLCIIVAAARRSTHIDRSVVLYANTMLAAAERVMPKALGEYGLSRKSDVQHKVMQIFANNPNTVHTTTTLWELVHTDLDGLKALQEVIQNLLLAGRIVGAGNGFIYRAEKHLSTDANKKYIDLSILTEEERK